MEKNLPYVSFPLADETYNKLVIPFLGKLDDGNVFKTIISLLFTISAVVLLIGGLYLSIAGLFGDTGFIEQYIANDNMETGKKVGSVIGLIFGFAISLVAVWVLFSFLKKRAEQLKVIQYNGLLDYVFNKTIPKLILVVGELLFILLLYAGILQIIAALIGSYAYAPLGTYPRLILGLFPGMEIFTNFVPAQIYGDYDNFGEFIKIGVMSIAGSFVLLIAFYIYKEIYTYALKLVTNLISFLPKFAIPLAIRRRDDN